MLPIINIAIPGIQEVPLNMEVSRA